MQTNVTIVTMIEVEAQMMFLNSNNMSLKLHRIWLCVGNFQDLYSLIENNVLQNTTSSCI